MAIEIKSGASANLASVDTANLALRAALYDSLGNNLTKARNASVDDVEGLPVMGQCLPGRLARFFRTDTVGTQKVGDPTCLFTDPLEVNTTLLTGALWAQSVTTQAAAVSANVKTYNSASTTTTTTGVMDVSLRKFDRKPNKLIRFAQRAMVKWGTTGALGTNGVIDFGFGAPASQTALAVTDGVFFRATAAGALSVVYAFGSSETTLATLGNWTSGVITSNGSVQGFVNGKSIRVDSYYNWAITLGDDFAVVQVMDPETGDIIFDRLFFVARTSAGMVSGSHVSVFNRTFNSGAATTAPQLLVNKVLVEQLDANLGVSFDDVMAGIQRGANILPTTQAQAANYANSAAPSSASLSNTAAGYTTLGGQWQFAAVAGAETDYALFGFTVPTGYRFRCKRIRIDAFNMGAAVATTAHLLQWGVSHNASTINLSTGTGWRQTIGAQGIASGGTIGQPFNPGYVEWIGNEVTESARLFIIILKIPVATATGSQIIRGTCRIEGNFE